MANYKQVSHTVVPETSVLLDIAPYGVTTPLSSASADTFGAYVEVSADIGVDKTLKYFHGRSEAGNSNVCELEIAEGAAASEVVKLRYKFIAAEMVYVPTNFPFTDNARIAVRVRDSQAAAKEFRFTMSVV